MKYHVSVASKAASEIIYSKKDLANPSVEIEKGIQNDLDSKAGVEIEFKDVRFKYKDSDEYALDGIHLCIPKAKTIAIVGRSGSGKSTLARAILGFIRVDSGSILVNGRNYSELDVKQIRALTAYVPQKAFVLNGSIEENIRFSKPSATRAEACKAAEEAALMDLIHQLPEGWDTVVSEDGSNLSTGELQRISIARAFLKGAPLVIMDEGPSSQDIKNEELLRNSFERLRIGKTVLIIAHRLETVKNAHFIHVMKKGRIVESGTHEQLLAMKGEYWELVQAWE